MFSMCLFSNFLCVLECMPLKLKSDKDNLSFATALEVEFGIKVEVLLTQMI